MKRELIEDGNCLIAEYLCPDWLVEKVLGGRLTMKDEYFQEKKALASGDTEDLGYHKSWKQIRVWSKLMQEFPREGTLEVLRDKWKWERRYLLALEEGSTEKGFKVIVNLIKHLKNERNKPVKGQKAESRTPA